MQNPESFDRHLRRYVIGTSLALSIILSVVLPAPAVADGSGDVIVVENDRGGTLRSRLAQIRDLERSGRRVAVTGRICYSTCTMFLGLPNTCISPQTVFGFHGPSSYGRPLDQDTFERASQIIADHYPSPIREWYLNTARHSIYRLHRIEGAEFIRMGVAAC